MKQMKRLKLYKDGKFVKSIPNVKGMFEHMAFTAKSNIDMISDLCIKEKYKISFIEDGHKCEIRIE